MANFPILVRYKGPDGNWSARVHADTADQAKGFIQQWKEQGHTEFDGEDANGQPINLKKLA